MILFLENYETVKRILVENVSTDWKRFAHCTYLHDIDCVVEQIDCGYSNNQSKMAAFVDKLYELDPLNYKKLIVNSLNVARRFDALFRLDLFESTEIVMKLLVERASSDWKSFAFYACLYEANCIIENIDQENNSNKMKMKALLEKLFDINPLQFKELIKSTLITMKRFSVLSAFEEDGCLGKEKEENKKVKEDTIEEPVFINDEPLVAQVDLGSGKTAVSIPIHHSLLEPAPLSFFNTGSLSHAALNEYSAADENKENVFVLKDQAKMGNILDNSELPLQLKMKIGKDWMNLGRFLSVSDNELDVIDTEYNDDLEEKAYRTLCAWKNQQKFPTLEALASAIYKINRLDLIRVLEKFSNKSFETENHLKPYFKDKAEMREALKKFYSDTYGKMDEIGRLVKTPAKVKLLNKFVELTVVDADEVENDTVNIAEQEFFLKKQMTYKPIKFNEVFSKNLPLLLISGIAGIGKTCLLRKCLLDWASGTLWQTVDFVVYFECRKLNQFQKIGNINELLKVFYKDIFQECDVCEHFSIMFVIDGLDEFAHLDKLIKHNPLNPCEESIVFALAEALNIQKYKCVVAGRVGVISQYKHKVRECTDKLTIQIMGLNDEGIDEYIEKFGNKKEIIKSVLKESYNANAMASVPFYLSTMCTIIAASGSYSFNTMTDLYCSVFLYFFQNHICKTDKTVHSMMQSESNKQHVLRVCKVAWELFNQGKILFSQDEMKSIVNDFDEVENELLGFIERVESQLGYQYQFAHLTLMEFCASVYAHIYLSSEEVISNKKLRSCLPMICGLANENKSCLVRFLANLKNSNEERNSLLNAVLDLVRIGVFSFFDDRKMFKECFFEAQASITENMKRSIDERDWLEIHINDGKTAHEVSHEKYFMEKFLGAGCKLNELNVRKNIFSEDEKKLIILCSTNVRRVCLRYPVKIDGWTPIHKIDWLQISISDNFVSKNEFEGFVLPWIRLAEELHLDLHNDTNFINDICKWLRCLNLKLLVIKYRGEYFYNIEEFKERNTKNV